jgi:hypothetical protein
MSINCRICGYLPVILRLAENTNDGLFNMTLESDGLRYMILKIKTEASNSYRFLLAPRLDVPLS